MLALARLPDFNRAYHPADLTWSPADATAGLQFPGIVVLISAGHSHLGHGGIAAARPDQLTTI